MPRKLWVFSESISIHAPRAGGDSDGRPAPVSSGYFNPRPPCGGRPCSAAILPSIVAFQSTPPVRGATACPPCSCRSGRISIHAPRAGGDGSVSSQSQVQFRFQSTPRAAGINTSGTPISIHAPRAGGDGAEGWNCIKTDTNFNPRPPCGGRLADSAYDKCVVHISIHAPRAGGDDAKKQAIQELSAISIHAPRAGGDNKPTAKIRAICIFQSTPPVRGATHVTHIR